MPAAVPRCDPTPQGGRSWELRAVTDLASLWNMQGRSDEARALLAGKVGPCKDTWAAPEIAETIGCSAIALELKTWITKLDLTFLSGGKHSVGAEYRVGRRRRKCTLKPLREGVYLIVVSTVRERECLHFELLNPSGRRREIDGSCLDRCRLSSHAHDLVAFRVYANRMNILPLEILD